MNSKLITIGALLAALALSPAYAARNSDDQTGTSSTMSGMSDDTTQKSKHKHHKHKKRHHKSKSDTSSGAGNTQG
jgi:hypothetical protein